MSDAWHDALAAARERCDELRHAMLALLYVRARKLADRERAREELAVERRAARAVRARSVRRSELGLLAASRMRRIQRRIEDDTAELTELDGQIDEVAAAYHDARRTAADLQTERLSAIATQAQVHAMRPRPELDDPLEEARASLLRLRALASLAG